MLISDFLSPAAQRARGHRAASPAAARAAICVLIVDPVEETFPFEGQAVLPISRGLNAARRRRRLVPRRCTCDRMSDASRRAARGLRAAAAGRFTVHRTDRPASEALLALASRIADRGSTGGAASLASGS